MFRSLFVSTLLMSAIAVAAEPEHRRVVKEMEKRAQAEYTDASNAVYEECKAEANAAGAQRFEFDASHAERITGGYRVKGLCIIKFEISAP